MLLANKLITEAEADLLYEKLATKVVPQGWRNVKNSLEEVLNRKLYETNI